MIARWTDPERFESSSRIKYALFPSNIVPGRGAALYFRPVQSVFARFPRFLLPALLLGLFAAFAIGSTRWMSCTFDEPFHLTSGYAALRLRDFRFGPNHPPLIRIWSSLPNALDPDVRFPTTEESYLLGMQRSTMTSFVGAPSTLDQLLLRGRLMIVLLAVGLGLLIYLWTLRLSGVVAATAALFLFALEPNLMAHGSLVTTDMGITLTFSLAVFCLWQVCRRITAPRLLGLGVCFALAQAAKFSALALWPAAGAVLAWRALGREPWEIGHTGSRLAGRLGKSAAAAGIMVVLMVFFLAVIWGAYGFRYEMAPRPGMPYDTTQDEEFALSDQAVGGALASFRLLPEGYVRGAVQLLTWPQRRFYFAGSLRDKALWYFYPVVLLVKTPTALLALATIGAVLVALRRARLPDSWPALVVPPATLLLAGMASGVNTGVRHLLPVFPFLVMAAGATAAILIKSKRGRVVVAALGLLTVVEFTMAYPDVLASFNLPSGGPSRGDRWVVDTDMDWGQGMKGLKRWMDENGVGEINLACHTFLSDGDLGIRSRRLPVYSNDFWRVDYEYPPGYLAASVSVLRGYTLQDREQVPLYERFLRQRPVAVIGNSIRVYRVDETLRIRRE